MEGEIKIPADMEDVGLLTMAQVATLAGISDETLRQTLKRQELKVTRIGKRRVGITRAEYRRWVEACTT
jgi:excisionase family DNA binding protein